MLLRRTFGLLDMFTPSRAHKFVRDPETNTFLRSDGTWVDDAGDAVRFGNAVEALHFCQCLGVPRDLELVITDESDMASVSIPLDSAY